jgi:hypothetical protein
MGKDKDKDKDVYCTVVVTWKIDWFWFDLILCALSADEALRNPM